MGTTLQLGHEEQTDQVRVRTELEQVSTKRNSALTIGVFDGVHLGHQHLVSVLRNEAAKSGLSAGVLTFRNHPASVLNPNFEPKYLTTLRARVEHLESTNVDYVIPITFDVELSRINATQFVAMLLQYLKMEILVVGPDFAMGHNREGTTATLRKLATEAGFKVKTVKPLLDTSGEAVRSSSVREALASGDVHKVSSLLGRRFVLEGKVVTGCGRGTSLGYPTANLDVPRELAFPGDGIYTTWAHINNHQYMATTSVGAKPTFGNGQRAIEAFVLDFNGDLYGQDMELEFVDRLRDQVRFDSVKTLQEQMHKDVEQTRRVLGDVKMQPV